MKTVPPVPDVPGLDSMAARRREPDMFGERPGSAPAPTLVEARDDAPGDPLDGFDEQPVWVVRAGRRSSRDKLGAGCRGLKHAIRGDSSFFAHAYRGTLIALVAAQLGVNPWGWCLLVLAASLVLIAELTHSAIDTLARAVGDPEEPPLRLAREIGTGIVLIAALASGAVTITVLTLKLGELLGWWR